MSKPISEQALETAIVADLTQGSLRRAPAVRLRQGAVPRPRPGHRLRPGHAAEGVEEVRRAAQGRRQAGLPEAGRRGGRGRRHGDRAAPGREGDRLQVPARVLQAGNEAQPRHRGSVPGEPVHRDAAGAVQRKDRPQSRPGAVPERPAAVHRGVEEPAQRPGRDRRDHAVPEHPRPA